jgi:hypothetical protein
MLLRQDGKGKGDAVRKGFEEATGDILMILDADSINKWRSLNRPPTCSSWPQRRIAHGIRWNAKKL